MSTCPAAFSIPSLNDDDEMPDDWPDGYCEVSPEPGAHCYLKATQTVREPYTPAAFKVECCDEHARDLIHFGYSAPMSLARVEYALREAYKSAQPEDELWCFDGLLEVILIREGRWMPVSYRVPVHLDNPAACWEVAA